MNFDLRYRFDINVGGAVQWSIVLFSAVAPLPFTQMTSGNSQVLNWSDRVDDPRLFLDLEFLFLCLKAATKIPYHLCSRVMDTKSTQVRSKYTNYSSCRLTAIHVIENRHIEQKARDDKVESALGLNNE